MQPPSQQLSDRAASRSQNADARDFGDPDELRQQIIELTQAYCKARWRKKEFVPGHTAVPVSGRVFDDQELTSLVDSSLDFWLTSGRYASQFETEFASVMGLRYALLVNSGSSANLIAFTTIMDETLGERRVRPGMKSLRSRPVFRLRLTQSFRTDAFRSLSTLIERRTTSTYRCSNLPARTRRRPL